MWSVDSDGWLSGWFRSGSHNQTKATIGYRKRESFSSSASIIHFLCIPLCIYLQYCSVNANMLKVFFLDKISQFGRGQVDAHRRGHICIGTKSESWATIFLMNTVVSLMQMAKKREAFRVEGAGSTNPPIHSQAVKFNFWAASIFDPFLPRPLNFNRHFFKRWKTASSYLIADRQAREAVMFPLFKYIP